MTIIARTPEQLEFLERVGDRLITYETKIGVERNFFCSLLNESDWSFIIKLHALFEAACTNLISHHLNEPELINVISRLELSGRTTGKIAFLSSLGLLEKRNRRYISDLSELRNTLVHDVKNVNFDLNEFIEKCDNPKVKHYAESFSPFDTFIRYAPCYDKNSKIGFPEEIREQSSINNIISRFRKNPKYHIWIGAFQVLQDIDESYSSSDFIQYEKALKLLS